MGIHLIMTTVFVATSAVGAGCSWAHPGANPYRGDPVAALADFDLRDDTRQKLRTLMAAHRTTDIATITRDTISGGDGQTGYTNLREMHSGHGQVCHGAVDRSAWSAQRRERGLVYCVDEACVLVPTICNNVSLVTRKPEEHGAAGPPSDDTPIDISPSAGPPGNSGIESAPPDSFSGAAPGNVVDAGGPAGDLPASGGPGDSSESGPGSATGGTPPLVGPPGGGGVDNGGGGVDNGGGGGGSACCGTVLPPTSPIASIPEPPIVLMWLCGLAGMIGMRAPRRRSRRSND